MRQRGFTLTKTAPVPAMNERGVALPAALIVLSILLALMVAFAVLSSTEPTIAANQSQTSRARAFAESGVERALWALSNPDLSDGLADPLPSPVPAAYNGGFTAVETIGGVTEGGFRLTVANAASGLPNERDITAVGLVPDNANPRAIRKIHATVMKIKKLDPPCALCLGGETPPDATSVLHVGGNAAIHVSTAAGATYCAGQAPSAAVLSTGVVRTNGTPTITAPDSGGSPVSTGVARSAFASFMLTNHDIAALKALAQIKGTYYQGSQTWTSPPPDGIVFVDTPSGEPLTVISPSSDLITVDIRGNWPAGWKGWLIVAGSIDISGRIDITGLIYAQNDIHIHGTGKGAIRGVVIGTNRVDNVSSVVHSDQLRNGRLTYDCQAVRDGGGTISQNWFVKNGTYKEVEGQ